MYPLVESSARYMYTLTAELNHVKEWAHCTHNNYSDVLVNENENEKGDCFPSTEKLSIERLAVIRAKTTWNVMHAHLGLDLLGNRGLINLRVSVNARTIVGKEVGQ